MVLNCLVELNKHQLFHFKHDVGGDRRSPTQALTRVTSDRRYKA